MKKFLEFEDGSSAKMIAVRVDKIFAVWGPDPLGRGTAIEVGVEDGFYYVKESYEEVLRKVEEALEEPAAPVRDSECPF